MAERKNFGYAELPEFKYQTFDRTTLQFSDVPLISLYPKDRTTAGDENKSADIESKDMASEDPPVDASQEEVPLTESPAETPTGGSESPADPIGKLHYDYLMKQSKPLIFTELTRPMTKQNLRKQHQMTKHPKSPRQTLPQLKTKQTAEKLLPKVLRHRTRPLNQNILRRVIP